MKRKFVLVFIFILVVGLIGIQEKAYAASPGVNKAEAGYRHFIALKEDGTVWTGGDNFYGELGNGTRNAVINYPAQVSGLSGIVDVDAGEFHCVALKNDGTVWSWGKNADGELGDGTNTNRYTPVQASGLSGIVDISCGIGNFTLALKNDGTLWAWGDNVNGQLGIGSNINKKIPVQVKNISNVTAIDAGRFFSLALTSSGTLWAWGTNVNGQLGDGTLTSRTLPVYIMSDVSSIGAGAFHSLVIKKDGTVWAWGNNSDGQLGDGTTRTIKKSPVQMIGASDVKSITGGWTHTLVVKNDGTVWVCGSDWWGELGDGIIHTDTSGNFKSTLIQLSGISGARSVTGGDNFTIVTLQNGSVWGCGLNSRGQLGE